MTRPYRNYKRDAANIINFFHNPTGQRKARRQTSINDVWAGLEKNGEQLLIAYCNQRWFFNGLLAPSYLAIGSPLGREYRKDFLDEQIFS